MRTTSAVLALLLAVSIVNGQTTKFVTSGYGTSIQTFSVDFSQGGELTLDNEQTWDLNLTFLSYDASTGSLYAIHEVDSYDDFENSGAVSRWTLSGSDWIQNEVLSVEGKGPCHVLLDKESNLLFVANYLGGSFAVFQIDPTSGAILQNVYSEQFEYASGVVPDRQADPHAHEAIVQGDNAYVIDLGADRIYQYKIVDGTIQKNGYADAPPGVGPRHMALPPTGNLAYVMNELEMSASVYEINEGTLSHLQTIPYTVAGADPAVQTGAEIEVGRNGNFLYLSTRGDGALVVFEIKSAQDGYLQQIQELKTLGDVPRHFALSEDGKNLVCGTQGANLIEVYSIDQTTGMVTFLTSETTIPDPTIITYL
ncbi:hypothetical protein TCAL_09250 [Tigriopus californicus]|uniref:6-phosphogluconolactonase n=1 Tax=Tigriopus californicus TaxID=6832 RepID=A0A553N8H4_TIGCA|nr:6-phosphogluconolactonase-like [Tigriopus californicus]TRY61744.1 hypothetical protein TCAL_09250 [Tigriopus californicus]